MSLQIDDESKLSLGRAVSMVVHNAAMAQGVGEHVMHAFIKEISDILIRFPADVFDNVFLPTDRAGTYHLTMKVSTKFKLHAALAAQKWAGIGHGLSPRLH
jgi:hypothetical protein